VVGTLLLHFIHYGVDIVSCIMLTQQWFSDMLAAFCVLNEIVVI